MVAGKVQAVAFGLIAATSLFFAYILDNPKLHARAERCTGYIWHGLANICRGFIETIPIAGNILTILYDSDPSSRMKYPFEAYRRVFVPLET